MAGDLAFIIYGLIVFIALLLMGFAFIGLSRRRRPLPPGEEYRPGKGPDPKGGDPGRPVVT